MQNSTHRRSTYKADETAIDYRFDSTNNKLHFKPLLAPYAKGLASNGYSSRIRRSAALSALQCFIELLHRFIIIIKSLRLLCHQ